MRVLCLLDTITPTCQTAYDGQSRLGWGEASSFAQQRLHHLQQHFHSQ
jgi:hypothetical protein